MELIMLFIALFVFFFGSVLALRAAEFGFSLADKALEHSGALIKLPFMIAFKLISFVGKFLIKRLIKNRTDSYTLKPIFDVTPLELQQMHHRLPQSEKPRPVLIENPSQRSFH